MSCSSFSRAAAFSSDNCRFIISDMGRNALIATRKELLMPVRSGSKSMRWITIMCIAFTTGICYPMMAAEKNLEGFQETKWGMTENQLQEIYHGELEHWTKTVGGVATPATKHPQF